MLLRLLALSVLFTASASAQKAEEPKPAQAPPPPPITTGAWQHEELRRFTAKEASQGVVADGGFLYVISNRAIGKYRQDTFERVGGWEGPKGGPFIHLNAGMIHEGRLYCAHSNFPGIPMVSSVEIWDTAGMQHVGTHSLGIDSGSLTWIDRAEKGGGWYACFAHYSKDKPRTGKDPAWTELVQYDDQWRRMGGWVFPQGILDIFGGSSCSGGVVGPDGQIFITGHDAKYLFVLKFPQAGSVLQWVDSIPISGEGQSFAWNPRTQGLFYSIVKKGQQVIESRITKKQP